MKKYLSTTALASIALLALSACGGGQAQQAASTASSSASSSAASSASASNQTGKLDIAEAWVKATEGKMTGVFGKLTNQGTEDIVIVEVDTKVSDENQLHTTEKDASGATAMKQVDSFTLKAGETFELVPGGNHLMLMDMQCSLPAGSQFELTLKDSKGQVYTFTAEARDYSGAQEEYAPGEGHDHDHDHDHAEEGHDHSHDQATASASALPQCS